MTKRDEILAVSKDIKHVRRVMVILKELVKNAPDYDDCIDKVAYECSLSHLAFHQLSKILDAMVKHRKDLMSD